MLNRSSNATVPPELRPWRLDGTTVQDTSLPLSLDVDMLRSYAGTEEEEKDERDQYREGSIERGTAGEPTSWDDFESPKSHPSTDDLMSSCAFSDRTTYHAPNDMQTSEYTPLANAQFQILKTSTNRTEPSLERTSQGPDDSYRHAVIPSRPQRSSRPPEMIWRLNQSSSEPRGQYARLGQDLVEIAMLACLLVYPTGLLVYFTPWYNDTLQVLLFRHFYDTMHAFRDDVEAKRDAVAFIYLLLVGFAPILTASTLWAIFGMPNRINASRQHGTSCMTRIIHALAHKPVWHLPVVCVASSSSSSSSASTKTIPEVKRWRSVYIDATRGELLFLAVLLTSNAFIIYQVVQRGRVSLSTPLDELCYVMGRAFAFNALFTMTWLLLPVTRHACVWLHLLRVEYPHGVKYHRWLGTFVLLFACLHALSLTLCFHLRGELRARLLPSWGAMYQDTLTRDANGVNAFGELALVTLLLMAIVALPVVRRRWYSLFASVHTVGAVIMLLAICVHYPATLWWLLPSVLAYISERAIACTHARYPVELVDMAPLPNGVTRLVLRRNLDEMTAGGAQFAPGQFVYLHIPRVSWLQWHPFAIASAPSAHPGLLTCYVKAATATTRTSWTSALYDLAKLAYATQRAPTVYVDGFYGAPPTLALHQSYRQLVLIAGGIGIAQVIAIVEETFNAFVRFQQRLHTSTAVSEWDDPLTAESSGPQQLWLLWTCRDLCLFKEFEPLFLRIRALDPQETHFRLRLFLTKMPTRAEIQYHSVTPCRFDDDDTDQAQDGERSDAAYSSAQRPQNHSALCCWPSRPFRQALATTLLQYVALLLVMAVVVPVAITAEWHALRHAKERLEEFTIAKAQNATGAESNGVFRPVMRMAHAVNVLTSCAAAAVLALVVERFQTHQQRQHERLYSQNRRNRPRHDDSELPQRNETITTASSEPYRPLAPRAPPASLLQPHWNSSADADTPRSPSWATAPPPCASMVSEYTYNDIMERLRIHSLRADLDKFLFSVRHHTSITTATPVTTVDTHPIGVLVSGPDALALSTERSVLTANQRWGSMDARFEYHRFMFRM